LLAVGSAIAKVLNNRWVQIGVLILSNLVPFFGPAMQVIIKGLLHAYHIVADIASTMQMYGMLLTGKIKELGRSVVSGFLGSLVETLEDGVFQGLQRWVGKIDGPDGGFIDWKKFTWGDFWHGLKDGLKTVWE